MLQQSTDHHERAPAELRSCVPGRPATRITHAIAHIVIERHARLRLQAALPIRVEPGTMAELEHGRGCTIQTVDAAGEIVLHRVVADREGRVRRIVTPVDSQPVPSR
ncbi:MAG: hypothetical protein JWN04_2882 [Myxococcaceae bacterium]|nr:hypothetical protein [Myxococcaceae bacterium]